MAVKLSPLGGVAAQFFNNDGVPLSGGLIYTYTAGTNTPSSTYTTGAGTIAHSNPIVLDSAGRVPGGEIWLMDNLAYKFVIKDAQANLIGTYDNIVGINSNFVNYTASQEIQTATAGQTVFNLTTMVYQPGTNSLSVFVDGVNQYGPGAQYAFVETSSTSVTFASGLHVGASVKFTTAVINNIGGVDASQVTYDPPFANSEITNVEYKLAQTVSVKDFGALGDGVTNDTVAIANAIAATPVNGTLYFPAGEYRGYMYVWRSDITIMGAGSASTIIKLPDNTPEVTVPHEGGGTVTGVPSVIEIGECALGNQANTYTRVNVIGLTVDGNWTTQTVPSTDLFGHGITATKTSWCFFDDVVAQNCLMTGFSNVINSNYNHCNVTVKDCGNAVVYGGHYPNFDINSSKFSQYKVVSSGGYYGARVLDNCWGSTGSFSITNSYYTGFVYNNQSVNYSYANTFTVNVRGGCTYGQAVSVGSNCSDSTIIANIEGVDGYGFLLGGANNATAARNNVIISNTQGCGNYGFSDNQYSCYNQLTINSYGDCAAQPVGASFAIYINGHDNIIQATASDPNTIARGMFLNTTSNNNQLIGFQFNSNLVETINDVGTNNSINWGSGKVTIASAATINVPLHGSLLSITGTTTIVSLSSATVMAGRVVTLTFDNSLTVQSAPGSGGTIKLAGAANFSATATDTLTLVSNGSYWIEVSRSVN